MFLLRLTRPALADIESILAWSHQHFGEAGRLRHSRARGRQATGVVHRPRHFILFRMRPADTVEVLRLIHDSMDLDETLAGTELL